MSLQIGRPIVPKEHGAWAVLYGVFLAGVGVAGRVTLPVGFLLVAVTAAAFANAPLALLARPRIGEPQASRRRQALVWFLVYGTIAAVVLVSLVVIFRMTFLLSFGVGAVFFLVLRAFLVRERDDRTLVGELVGTAGLTMVGPAAHAVAVGKVLPISAVLWLLLFLFFASGVFYVRMRIHGMIAQRKGEESNPARVPCLVYHALLVVMVPVLAVARVTPWPVLVAFAPAIWRAAAGLPRQESTINLRRLGWSEVAVASAFVLLLIAAFRFTPLAG